MNKCNGVYRFRRGFVVGPDHGPTRVGRLDIVVGHIHQIAGDRRHVIRQRVRQMFRVSPVPFFLCECADHLKRVFGFRYTLRGVQDEGRAIGCRCSCSAWFIRDQSPNGRQHVFDIMCLCHCPRPVLLVRQS